MPEYVTHRDALPRAELESLRDALLGSRFVARSPLMGTFRASRGFSFIFTQAGRATLEERFPFLSAYLRCILDGDSARELVPRTRWRWFGARAAAQRPNAFYLNLLLLDAGTPVGRHIDATLQEPSGLRHATPAHVSVLYLRVPPEARGGALRLFRDNEAKGDVAPEPGLLVHFRGDLAHEVQPFTGGPEGALRASLVCEQYAFTNRVLARIPEFRIQSKAGFSAYLEAQRERDGASPSVGTLEE
ncbi:2OG-Fe(II) oxygenase [Corallococcus praedator]|uniref:2OG-Fe(II) oxygenase n=1 Tax=Corallococcus praedator TaxID=2316724 RepID=A0ABX9QPB0_9BACT|nr:MULTISPECIES: 2OG-Fe(II) oxygenase [Corallococcus]RKH11111.1 2OG-Fe(II) oxygenase [Corallococcus sp. CA047B]RKH33668.1 2OG-Fe(II) oxygenase [Corallococcus sp. CA031C]RKI14676.1 2OG-Fe(II) oxygenase [Corallococcus praedator]